jgi:hypothetical protein
MERENISSIINLVQKMLSTFTKLSQQPMLCTQTAKKNGIEADDERN